MSAGRRVLLVHTGGTLGMSGSPLVPDAYGAALMDAVPELGRIANLDVRIVFNMDSSDIVPAHWSALARLIASERVNYDGFVIVHGTDTMAYTAGALSFALIGLEAPIILTGAQRPLASLRTDARRNLADAVELATMDFPEVAICFDGLLLRGCKAVKADATTYRAFTSPGVAPLAVLGTRVRKGPHVGRGVGDFECHPQFDPAVDVVFIAPGTTAKNLGYRLNRPDLRGVVIAAYGAGTLPGNGAAEAVQRAVESGVDVVVVTQHGGAVDLQLYPNSRALAEAGAIDGGAMRVEAAVPKLMHALGRFRDDREARRHYLLTDVAGERQ